MLGADAHGLEDNVRRFLASLRQGVSTEQETSGSTTPLARCLGSKDAGTHKKLSEEAYLPRDGQLRRTSSMAALILAAWALAAWLLVRLFLYALRERRYALEARRLGCLPAPQQQNELPFGLDYMWKGLKADRERQFPTYINERYALCGNRTMHYTILGTPGYLTCDPRNLQAILATQFRDFELGPYRRGLMRPLLGNGIFAADGHQWERARAMMRPQFARDQVADLELEEEHVANLMRALAVDPGLGWTPAVDLQVLFFRLTLDSACQFLFGRSIDSQLLNLPANAGGATLNIGAETDEANFARAFDESQFWCASRGRFQDFYWLMDGWPFRKHIKVVHSFIDHFVQLALQKRREGTKIEEKGRYVFLDALVAETQDPIELRYQLVNILLAGRDTTASTLGWAFYVLARHPDVWRKLRNAVLNDFGTYKNPTDISFEKLKGCTYLQHFIHETLRLYPVVSVNTRRAVKPTTLPVGGGPDGTAPLFVRPDMNIDYSVHTMHRLEKYWGPDALEFKPERWIARRPGWEYLPFNGGPRICLGRMFPVPKTMLRRQVTNQSNQNNLHL